MKKLADWADKVYERNVLLQRSQSLVSRREAMYGGSTAVANGDAAASRNNPIQSTFESGNGAPRRVIESPDVTVVLAQSSRNGSDMSQLRRSVSAARREPTYAASPAPLSAAPPIATQSAVVSPTREGMGIRRKATPTRVEPGSPTLHATESVRYYRPEQGDWSRTRS